MNTDTLRAAREMRRLQEQMIRRRESDIKQGAQQDRADDYLAPDERSWRAVWRTFGWRELWTALAAAAWLLSMWLVWSWKANL